MSTTTLLEPAATYARAANATATYARNARSRKATIGLWTAQGVLAALFLFAGGMKLIVPADALAAQSHLPGAFMKFIGICETLGGLGVILPTLTKIRPALTPLAALGLVIIMIGATVVSVLQGQAAAAPIPFAVGLLCAFVAYNRRVAL